MFAGLKNKIKEETGGDVSRITSLVTSAPPKVLTKGRHSRQGSATSLGSFTIDGTKDDPSTGASSLDLKLADGRVLTPKEFKRLESKEDEWRKKLQKKDEEYAAQLKRVEDTWKKKIEEKERDLQKLLDKKEIENNVLLSEIRDLQSNVLKLQEEVKQSAEYKTKLCQYQDDLDQLEGFQNQEMAKIKHLLLQKEQLLVEKEKSLNQQNQKVAELNAEVRKLLETERKLSDAEDQLEALRHESEQEKAVLTSRLAAQEESARHLKDRLAVLEERCRTGCLALGGELTPDDRVQGLLGERALLERLLSEAHEHMSEVKTTWSGKITSLETQVGRLCRQASEESAERREAERERDALTVRLRAAEADAAASEQKMTSLEQERDVLAEEVKALGLRLEQQAMLLDESISSVNENVLANKSELEEKIKALAELEERNSKLSEALNKEKSSCERLKEEVSELQEVCEEEKNLGKQLRSDVGRERRERDELMMRNAEVSQEVELVRQELRSVQQEANDMHSKIKEMQATIREREQTLAKERIERDTLSRKVEDLQKLEKEKTMAVVGEEELRERNNELESQLLERNKSVKILQQRLSDMKKAMQRELKVPSRSIDPGGHNGEGCIPPHGPALLTPSCPDDSPDDVNFKYLKHVLFKFLTCREYEAQHLTRAVATLLRFTAEEERLLRETMDWKTSWFGTKPKISSGPKSNPPS